MGKVTSLSLPPTCWKELFNSVCLAVWSGSPLKLFCLSFGAGSLSLLSGPLAALCVWKQLLPHLYRGAKSSPAAARVARLATVDCGTSGAIVAVSFPAWLTEPNLARPWASLHGALALFSLLTELLSPPNLQPSSAMGGHVRKAMRETLERG